MKVKEEKKFSIKSSIGKTNMLGAHISYRQKLGIFKDRFLNTAIPS